jgi:hypothetical protein
MKRPASAFEDAIEQARALPLKAGLLGLELKRASAVERVGPCPLCGGTDRFGVNSRKRIWHCRGCKAGGNDAVSLAMHVGGLSFVGAIERLTGARRERADQVGNRRPTPRPVEWTSEDDEGDAARNRRNLAMAARIVEEMVPLAGTFGESYLAEHRGIDVEAIVDVLERKDAIGFHSKVFFREDGHPLDGQHLWCIDGTFIRPRPEKMSSGGGPRPRVRSWRMEPFSPRRANGELRHRPKAVAPKKGRSRVTNNALFLPGADRAKARRFRDLIRAYTAGIETLDQPVLMLAKSAALASLRIERLQAQVVGDQDVDDGKLVRLTGVLGRTLSALRAMKPMAQDEHRADSLEAHMAQIVARREAKRESELAAAASEAPQDPA